MIGLCIKYFHENYGGMLQAYATTQIFEKRGIEYELIQYEKKLSVFEKIKSVPRLLNGVLLNDKYEMFLKEIGKRKHPEFAANDDIRKQSFKKFKDRYFTKLSQQYVGYKALCKGAEKYSAVVTGSDQLWSPAGLPTNYYNLKFVSKNITKISYASSFGVKYIPWYQKKRTREYLKRIEYISMRENRGSEIVRELTDRTVPTVLDPVFMLNADEWEEVTANIREFDEPYIFAYFLGNNLKYRHKVQEFAEKNNLKIVALRHLDQYIEEDEGFGDYAPYDIGPDKFLDLIRGALYVFTDSFHGTCFSIIYRKQFLVFNRYLENSKHSKNSRIDTLCKNLKLENRRCIDGNVDNAKEKINYDMVEVELSKLKIESERYLDNALEGIS